MEEYVTVGDLIELLKKHPKKAYVNLKLGDDLYGILKDNLKSVFFRATENNTPCVDIHTGITDVDMHYDCKLEADDRIFNIRTKLEEVFESNI